MTAVIGRALALGGVALLAVVNPAEARADAAADCAALGDAVRADHGLSIGELTAVVRPPMAAPVPQSPSFAPPPPPEQLPAHCEVIGVRQSRTGIDGQHYAVRFHLRLPEVWNGKLFFQGGGGSNGELGDAIGRLGRSPSALAQGYAVLSQDSGHDNATNFNPMRGGTVAFGFDPIARRNYGHASLELSVSAARQVIQRRYGKLPTKSYFVGCSKGGQEGLALAQRYPGLFDGIAATAPAMSLPRAAISEAWDTQSFASTVTSSGQRLTPGALASSFSDADLALVSKAVLAACDRLDGLADGMINAFTRCTSARVVPQLTRKICEKGKQDGCLTNAQVATLRRIHDGPRDSKGNPLYASFPWDAGWSAPGWRIWKIGSADGQVPALNLILGAPSLASVFSTPPVAIAPGPDAGLAYHMGFSMDRDAPGIYARNGDFTASSWDDVNARSTDLSAFTARGGRLIVLHGVSDPVFSIADTVAWYQKTVASGGAAAKAALRLFAIPGMNHCAGGPATDSGDTFAALVDWVEQGKAPEQIVAQAGPGSPWPGRTRPLCAFPKIARYRGKGDPEAAASFTCV